MIKCGQHVSVDFGAQFFEGVCLKDCEDWAAEPLIIKDDLTGEELSLHTWLAEEVIIS